MDFLSGPTWLQSQLSSSCRDEVDGLADGAFRSFDRDYEKASERERRPYHPFSGFYQDEGGARHREEGGGGGGEFHDYW